MRDRFYRGVIWGAGVIAIIVAVVFAWILFSDVRALGVFL